VARRDGAMSSFSKEGIPLDTCDLTRTKRSFLELLMVYENEAAWRRLCFSNFYI
jgi:hypothetical protein